MTKDQRQQDTPTPTDRDRATAAPERGNPAAAQPGEGTEPRSGERLTQHNSQGLAGAQGSGGGADRGIRQAPTRPNHPPGGNPAAGDDPGAPPASGADSAGGGGIDR